MKQKLPLIFFFIFLIWGAPTFAQSPEDVFKSLVNLNIGERVPTQILQQGFVIEETEGGTKYLLDSDFYSTPHILKIENDILTYLEISIPLENLEEYRSLLLSLGKPEVDIAKTEMLRLLAYPSKGIGFIVSDYEKGDVQLMKFPQKTVPDFLQHEGSGFIPIPRSDTSIFQEELSLLEPEIVRTEPKIPLFLTSPFFIGGAILIAGITIFMAIKAARKKRAQKITPKPMPPTPIQ